MTLTLSQIYNRQSQRQFARRIELKRHLQAGGYEGSWKDLASLVPTQVIIDKVVDSISNELPNDDYNFGITTIGNLKLSLLSTTGQFDDETNPNSVFFDGFLRHRTLVRVLDGYVDNMTDPSNPVEVLIEVFYGFIDSTSTSTKVDESNTIQYLQCVDALSFLLRENTISDVSPLVSTSLNALIYEIMNRAEFTDYFSVPLINIAAGYNILSLDLSVYEGQMQLFSLFEELSVGHSIAYLRNGEFFYTGIDPNPILKESFFENRIIKFYNYDDGSARVIERLYWEEQAESFIAPTNFFNRTKTFNIQAVTNSFQRQNVLNFIGNRLRVQKQQVRLHVPYYPDVFVLDKVKVSTINIYPSDAFIWDVSRWDDGSRWRDPIGAKTIAQNRDWLVRSVTHADFVTQILLEEIT